MHVFKAWFFSSLKSILMIHFDNLSTKDWEKSYCFIIYSMFILLLLKRDLVCVAGTIGCNMLNVTRDGNGSVTVATVRFFSETLLLNSCDETFCLLYCEYNLFHFNCVQSYLQKVFHKKSHQFNQVAVFSFNWYQNISLLLVITFISVT